MFYALPEELIWIILEFAGMDKKSNMDKVLDQFIKGGFNRKNLKIHPYLDKQHWCARKFWLGSRYMCISPTSWGLYSRPIYTLKKEWCLKNYFAVYSQEQRGRIRNIWGGWNPVSKWLQNIEKFETAHPTFATYLPERKNRFNIKCNSEFYKERSKKREKKLARSLKFQQKKAQDLLTGVSNIN